ncbi:hypothetical protein RSAG8_12767, partial [Rhizoctonia solani AG-8 WAC10335]
MAKIQIAPVIIDLVNDQDNKPTTRHRHHHHYHHYHDLTWLCPPVEAPGDSDALTISTKSCTTSALELATKPEEFGAWTQKAKLDPVIKTTLPNTVIFNPIRDLQAASTTIPGWLRTLESPEFGFIPPTLLKWKDALCSTLQQSSSGYSTGRDGDLELPFVVQTIFRTCHHHEMLQSLDNYGLESERAARIYIDALIRCGVDSDALAKYRLPPLTPITDRVRVATTTASGVILLPIANFNPYNLSPEFRTATSAATNTLENPENRDLTLVHCVVELKWMGSGENQMKMALVSALLQKKILGTTEQFVFGVFQFDRDFLEVNAGLWLDDEIKVYKVGTYSLRAPASLIEFHLLLRGVNQLARVYRDQLMELSPVLQRAIETNLPVSEWAPIRVTTTRENFEESGDSEQSGGESSIQSGLSLELSVLGQWDVDDRIDAFRQSMRSCDSDAMDVEVSWNH